MNDNIKTNLDVESSIKKVNEKISSNVTIGNTINSGVYEEMDFSGLTSNNLTIDEVLKIVPRNGEIDSNSIDYSRIATNTYDAVAGRFLNNIYAPWGENGTLTYEIRDNGSVLIRNDDVAMGYTDIEGISKIVTNFEKSEPIKTNPNRPTGKIDYSQTKQESITNLNKPSKIYYSSDDLKNNIDIRKMLINYGGVALENSELENDIYSIDKKSGVTIYNSNNDVVFSVDEEGNSVCHLNLINDGDREIFKYDSTYKRVQKGDDIYRYENEKLIWKVDKDGVRTEYDDFGNELSTRTPGGPKIYSDGSMVEYDDNNNVQKIVSVDGFEYTLYPSGETKKIVYPSGDIDEFDLEGNKIKTTYKDGSGYTFYSSKNVKTSFNSDGTGKSYYENGDISSETIKDENGSLKTSTSFLNYAKHKFMGDADK